MTPRNKLTPKQWAALAEARRAGATIKELQERFGVSYAVACEVARNNDAYPAQGAAACVHPCISAWMLKNKVSRKELAIRCGVTLQGLCRFLRGATKTPSDRTMEALQRVTGLNYQQIMEIKEEDHAK